MKRGSHHRSRRKTLAYTAKLILAGNALAAIFKAERALDALVSWLFPPTSIVSWEARSNVQTGVVRETAGRRLLVQNSSTGKSSWIDVYRLTGREK